MSALHCPYAVAPMIAVTNHFFRYLIRLISKQVILYTEMVAVQALIHGPRDLLLHYDSIEHPLVLQLGGSDPSLLAVCSQLGEARGFDAINLNLGCPSERVYAGEFGLCLMKDSKRVVDCLKAMQDAVSIPVTVKIRTGVDAQDDYPFLSEFVQALYDVGLKEVIVHARKGWLEGLSPKENRNIPPLDYTRVYQLKKDFPDLRVGINGGIQTFEEAEIHLQHVDQVMMGRAIDRQPYYLATLDARMVGGETPVPERVICLEQYVDYLSKLSTFSTSLALRPLMGLLHGQPMSRLHRRTLSDWIMARPALPCVEIIRGLEKMVGDYRSSLK